MSTIIVYDRPGCGPVCVENTVSQLQRVCDDRSQCVKLFSECSDPFNPREVSLFTVPGGNGIEMQKDGLFTDTAAKIRRLVQIDGVSYLGICAGAIEATRDFSMSQFNTYNGNKLELEPLRYKPSINLYNGSSVLVPNLSDDLGLCTSQDILIKKSDEKSYHSKIIELKGCYFPSPAQTEDTSVILEYMQDCERSYASQYTIKTSACAIKHKSQNGTIVLSGAHPELDGSAISEISRRIARSEREREAFSSAASEIAPHDKQRDEIMKLFLDELSIPTKS